MVVVEGLAGGRYALVAKLHHAILDGVSGASVLAAFLDLGPARPGRCPSRPSRGTPSPCPRRAPCSRTRRPRSARQPEAAGGGLQRGVDAMVGVAEHNRTAGRGRAARRRRPRSARRGPRSTGACRSRRRFASVAVPARGRPRLVRSAFGTTVNDVLLAGVGRGAWPASSRRAASARTARWWPWSRSRPAGSAAGGDGGGLGNQVLGDAGLPGHRRRRPGGAAGGRLPGDAGGQGPGAPDRRPAAGRRGPGGARRPWPPGWRGWASGLGLFDRVPPLVQRHRLERARARGLAVVCREPGGGPVPGRARWPTGWG